MATIYKIEVGEFIYYGSTKQKLYLRQASHNCTLKENSNRKLYNKCRELNINKIKCIKIENCKKEDRFIREDYYINNANKEYLLNMMNSQQNLLKYKLSNKKYYKDNKDIISEKAKKYYEDNKEQKKEKSKKYHENNKNICNQKNKQRSSVKIECQCGLIARYDTINSKKHKNSVKHLNFINNL